MQKLLPENLPRILNDAARRYVFHSRIGVQDEPVAMD